ncbi:MAG: hypothetical protein MJZ87_08465 [Bacteroidales bacterium]|nr:hypothetical protein [Bacteroidales bacterium]
MKNFVTYILVIVFSLTIVGCHHSDNKNGKRRFGQKQAELLDLYNSADSIYYQQHRIDTAVFGRFIRKAVDFAAKYPKDEISSDMLYRAGVGSMILAKAAPDRERTAEYAKQAIAIFNTYQKQYPDGEKAEFCYYQRGIIYDDILGDIRSAEDEFRDFINRNPNDSLTPQLQQYIKLLGMSEKELGETLDIE